MFAVAPSVSTSISAPIAMAITPAIAISKAPIVVAVVMTIIFGMPFHYIIFRFITVTNNDLCISSSPVGCVFHPVQIIAQIWPRLIDHYFVSSV